MAAVPTTYHNAAQRGCVKLSTQLAEFYLLISNLELMKKNGFVTKLYRHSLTTVLGQVHTLAGAF